jgi:hypothetical protein
LLIRVLVNPLCTAKMKIAVAIGYFFSVGINEALDKQQ